MSRTEELRKLTTAWNDAWNSHDSEQLAAFFADGSTYYEPDLSGPMPGKQGVRQAAEKTWSEWPDASFEEVSTTIAEPRVVLEWRSSAKHRSGKQIELQGVDVLEWQGDKIQAVRVYYDVHSRIVALGQG